LYHSGLWNAICLFVLYRIAMLFVWAGCGFGVHMRHSIAFLALPLAVASGCLRSGHSRLKDEVPASVSDTAELGLGYNSLTKQFHNILCVNGKEREERLGNTTGTLTYSEDL